MIFRGMARRATKSTRLQSSVNLNADDRLTVYKPAEWTPPPTNEEVFTTQTPDKRPMRWPMDFSLPRTPNRVSKGDRGVIMRLHHYGCKNRWMFHLVIHKVCLRCYLFLANDFALRMSKFMNMYMLLFRNVSKRAKIGNTL